MINRKEWVLRHQPVLTEVSAASPLTVGNGDFAFTADITGLQTLYREYAAETPLCTMSSRGWHTVPADTPTGRYSLADVRMDRYDACGREVTYARTKFPGNERVYDWLRVNPHRLSLVRVGLRLRGAELTAPDFTGIRQELHLYSGLLESRFSLRGVPCRVLTACAPEKDVLAFRVESALLTEGLTVDLDLPYGAPDITGADWQAADRHRTTLENGLIRCGMDGLRYALRVRAPGAETAQVAAHRIRVTSAQPVLEMTVAFAPEEPEALAAPEVFGACEAWWADFWERGGALDLSGATDPRAMELERRIVLSLYLLTVNSSGHVPPAETGLTCNSWYGKAHLEMHFWHMAWAPLWGHGELLERCLPWYHAHLPEARANAARNGYRGARWPKMVAEDAQDSPSPIAVLLVWQQPHLIVLLEMLRRTMAPERAEAFCRTHLPLVRETADFMADYAVRDERGVYHLEPPVIPVQERYAPEDTRDPSFEVAYWKLGLQLAIDWMERAGEGVEPVWRDVAAHMAPPPLHEGRYIAHANRPDTFETMAEDHPSMLQCLGMLPGADIDPAAMARTLDRVLEVWQENTLWGWDFAVMAMTAVRLGQPGLALDLLLRETNKNTYVISGNNRQVSRRDLPLYLPGNGSLLLAAAMLAAGWQGSEDMPGFRPELGWQARCEGVGRCL